MSYNWNMTEDLKYEMLKASWQEGVVDLDDYLIIPGEKTLNGTWLNLF